jgi:hypothetical protein
MCTDELAAFVEVLLRRGTSLLFKLFKLFNVMFLLQLMMFLPALTLATIPALTLPLPTILRPPLAAHKALQLSVEHLAHLLCVAPVSDFPKRLA